MTYHFLLADATFYLSPNIVSLRCVIFNLWKQMVLLTIKSPVEAKLIFEISCKLPNLWLPCFFFVFFIFSGKVIFFSFLFPLVLCYTLLYKPYDFHLYGFYILSSHTKKKKMQIEEYKKVSGWDESATDIVFQIWYQLLIIRKT